MRMLLLSTQIRHTLPIVVEFSRQNSLSVGEGYQQIDLWPASESRYLNVLRLGGEYLRMRQMLLLV